MTNGHASLWSMFRLIALGIFAIPICAQNAPNPYDLARAIEGRYEISGIDSEVESWIDLSLPDFEPVLEFTMWPQVRREVRANVMESRPDKRADFEDLANINGGPSNEQLLVNTLPRLKEIASGSDAENQDRLRLTLSRCKDTPEKRTLQALLDKH
jgi:hypothetical protein